MTAHKTSILLKVFSGPHVGAEIPLVDGEYLIGSSDECDIVLQDFTIDYKHALLKINGMLVSVVPFENKPLLIGGRLSDADKSNNIDHYSMITIGTTHLAIGHNTGDWTKVRIPKISNKSFETSQDIKNKYNHNKFGLTFYFFTRVLQKLIFLLRDFIVRFHQAVSVIKSLWDGFIITKKQKVFGVSAGIIMCSSILTVWLINNANNSNLSASAYGKKVIVASASSLGLSDVHADSLDDSKLLIAGYVDNEQQLEQLQVESKKLTNLNVDYAVYTGSELRDKALVILKQLKINSVDVVYNGKGTLVLSGYHGSDNQWTKTKDMLMHDIPGVLSVDYKEVKNLKTREKNLRSRLNETRLNKKVSVERQDGNIIVAGILANNEIHELKKIVDKFRSDYGKYPQIKVDLIDSQNAMDFDIKSVRIGDVSYIVTTEGDRYLAGSFLPNGFTIKSISPDEIIMQKNKIEVVYPLN